jgi:hypothetical protein
MGTDSGSDGHPIDEYLARAAKRPRVQAAGGQDGNGHSGNVSATVEAQVQNAQDNLQDEDASEADDSADSHAGSMTSDEGELDGEEGEADPDRDDDDSSGDDEANGAQQGANGEEGDAVVPSDAPAAGAPLDGEPRAPGATAQDAAAGDKPSAAVPAEPVETNMTESLPGGATGGGAQRSSKPRSKPATRGRAAKASPVEGNPVGVILVDDTEEIVRDFDVAKLLRNPRYFDDFAEVQTCRCFNCGQMGHQARDCTNQARVKPCHLCAQFGHDGRECPNRKTPVPGVGRQGRGVLNGRGPVARYVGAEAKVFALERRRAQAGAAGGAWGLVGAAANDWGGGDERWRKGTTV